MPELTTHYLKDLREKRLHQTNPPFVGGLRTGYVRAWMFVVLKVWLIVALVNGVTTMATIEKNMALLDAFVRNDFSHPELFFDEKPQTVIAYNFTNPAGKTRTSHNIITGTVASANTSTTGSPVNVLNSILTTPGQKLVTNISEEYVDQLIRYNLASSIDLGFVLGNGTALRGCLQVKSDGIIYGTGRQCNQGTGGGGAATVSMSIGSTVTGATEGSVLFAGPAGVLAQDNSNFFWDNNTQRLGIGNTAPAAALSVGPASEFQVDTNGAIISANGINSAGTISFTALSGAGTKCLQTDNNGTVGVAAAGCSDGAITVGTTGIGSGTSGRVLYNNAGVLGEMTTTGSGTVLALATSPTLVGIINTGTLSTTVSSATALTVANTGTNYALQVDTSATGTGLKVTANTSGNGVALAVISPNGNDFLTLDAKGSGEVRLGSSSTGDILLGGGSSSTGCTATNSTGAFTCTSDITVSTTTAGYKIGSSYMVRASTANNNYYYGNSGPADATLGGLNVGIGGALTGLVSGACPGYGTTCPGGYNVAIGYAALAGAVTTNDNVALGAFALNANTSGGANSAFGSSALTSNIDGSFNMALGRQALQGNVHGSKNVAFGYQALYSMNVGSLAETKNIGIGAAAGYGISTGTKNTVIGTNSYLDNGNAFTGSANTIIGQAVTGLPVALSNSIILADGDGNKLAVFGNSDWGNGASVSGPVITVGRNTNATNTAAGSINFQRRNGTAGYVWQDGNGDLRISSSSPLSGTDTSGGVVVGSQTSTRSTKQDINDYTDYTNALQMVADAPLHTFRYIKEVQNDPSQAKTRIGFIADEVPGAFMWGNSIDQVSVNGILMASVKALNTKIDIISSQQPSYQVNTPPIVMGQPNLANTPITLKSHLYLSADSVGQAQILAGDTSVRVSFNKPYQYQPIVTTTPNSRVGSEYWIDDKDASGFTIYIDESANHDVTFDWHAFASPSTKLTVSNGNTEGVILVTNEVVTPPTTPPAPESGDDNGTVAGETNTTGSDGSLLDDSPIPTTVDVESTPPSADEPSPPAEIPNEDIQDNSSTSL